MAMISSAMWYDSPDDIKMQTISLGPLKLSYKQFYVGFMSAMIALVPSMILVLIFRNRKFRGEQCTGCHVPWWSIFCAYILVFLCVGSSATFVFLYSLQWGGVKSLEWMMSFVLAIFQSVIILEPVKVSRNISNFHIKLFVVNMFAYYFLLLTNVQDYQLGYKNSRRDKAYNNKIIYKNYKFSIKTQMFV